MVDFIKLQVSDNSDFENHIVNNQIVDLKTFTNNFTGEIQLYPKVGKLLNLDVRINPVFTNISGSLHKFENLCHLGEEQNYNDFTYYQLSNLIPYLIDVFNIGDSNSLSYLEIGFNLKVDYNLQKFIDSQLLMYNYKSHSKDLKFGGKGDYKEFIKTDYSIKIYNKSKHFKLKESLLRIELKITKKRFLQKLGIFQLEDLLSRDNLFSVFKILYEEFEKVLIIDDFNDLEIPQKDIDKLNKYTNPNYWQRIKETASYKVQKRLKNDFGLLLNKYNLNTTKQDLKDKLVYKFWELINHNCNELYYPKDSA